MNVLTHFPKSRLSELSGNFGGMSREEAVEAAKRELEALRPEAEKAIEAAIAKLETIAGSARPEKAQAMMKDMLAPADQIVTLSGTYGHAALDKATRSLCDLLDGLI